MTFTILTLKQSNADPQEISEFHLQVGDCNLFGAIESWASSMEGTDMLEGVSAENLLNGVSDLAEEAECDNVWHFSLEIGDCSILITVVKTDMEKYPYYDEDAAIEYVERNLQQDFAGQYTREDILLVLTLELEYLKESGIAVTKFSQTFVEGLEVNEESEIKKENYIFTKALKFHKKHLKDDFVEDVLDLEYEYMEKAGLLIDEKLKLMGLEFRQPEQN